MEKREDPAIRIEKLEFLVAHLQKSFDELNMVLFTQQRERDSIQFQRDNAPDTSPLRGSEHFEYKECARRL